MEALRRGIKTNEKYQDAEKYSKQLDGIARITNWHQLKLKNEKANQLHNQKVQMDIFLKSAGQELKVKRRTRLEQLYKEDNEAYEHQLKQMGLAIYKTKV